MNEWTKEWNITNEILWNSFVGNTEKTIERIHILMLGLQGLACMCKVKHFVDSSIPANFFWDISVRFLSWECWDFWRRHDHFRRFPKTSEVCRSLPNASSLPVLFTSKIRDREEGIAIYSFYTWISFLTWVWVNIFLEIVSSRTATTHIFQSGVRNWPAGVSRREIEVFNPQAWDSRLRRESWQVYSSHVRTLFIKWIYVSLSHKPFFP